MPDVSFKNEDGSARNTPRIIDAPETTDANVGAVANPTEVVDVGAIKKIEEEAKNAIEALLHQGEKDA